MVLEASLQSAVVSDQNLESAHRKSCMCADCNHKKCCCEAMTDTTPVFRPVCALPSTELLNGSSVAPRCANGTINLVIDGGLTSTLQASIVPLDDAITEWLSKPPLAPPRG